MNIHVNTILSFSADDPCLCGFIKAQAAKAWFISATISSSTQR